CARDTNFLFFFARSRLHRTPRRFYEIGRRLELLALSVFRDRIVRGRGIKVEGLIRGSQLLEALEVWRRLGSFQGRGCAELGAQGLGLGGRFGTGAITRETII